MDIIKPNKHKSAHKDVDVKVNSTHQSSESDKQILKSKIAQKADYTAPQAKIDFAKTVADLIVKFNPKRQKMK